MDRLRFRYPVLCFFVLLITLLTASGAALRLYAQSAAESEPNNDFGVANAIALNSAVGGAINPTRDGDWYTFTVERHGELRVTVSGVAAELDVNLRMWNGNKDVLTNWYAPLAKGGNTDALVDLPAPGRYYLEVRDGSDDASSPQPYTLTTTFTPSADLNEPNDDFNRVTPLAFDQRVPATILPVRDSDWFVVTVAHHGELQLHVADVPAELDVNLRVWNGNKDVLTNWFAPLAKGGDTDAVVDLPAAGRYVVEVRDGSDDMRAIQPFTLRAAFTPSPDALEPNNDFGSPANLVLGQALQATILPVRDSDWFAFDVATHGELRVEVSAVPAELDVVLRLWNGNKDVLTNWFTPLAKGGNTSALVDLPAAGRYVLEVRDGSDDARSVQPFTLRADFTPSPDGFEANNDFGSAAAVGVDRSVQATILPVRDADWFSFDVATHGELRVQASNVPAEMDLVYRLWNNNKDVLTNWYAPLAKGGNTDGVIDLAAPGRYFLEVHDGSDDARSIQPYTLSTKFLAAADKGEPNNSLETATPVALDETLPGNILPAGDSDWCRIEVTQPGDLHILVTNVAPELAIAFRLWDDKGAVLTNWFSPLSQGGNTEAVVPITAAGVYYVEVADNNSAARSIQPYLLRFSMSPIDPATMTPPAPPVSATASVTGTGAFTATTGATILTSGQVGALGAEIFVQEPRNPDVDGARLSVLPDSLDALKTVHISVSDRGPEGAPFGLQPAGPYWYFDPDGLNFKQPVTITLPVPTGAAEAQMFIGHWNGSAWEDLGGAMQDGLISAQTSGFSAYGVFCGSLSSYRNISVINESTAPYIEMHYVSGPNPDPDNPDPSLSAGCPIPNDKPQKLQINQNQSGWLLLRPGLYHFVVAYPQPQPGTANSLFVTVRPGEPLTIRITDSGATSDDPNVAINFPGREIVAGTNVRPTIACNAVVPPGVTLANLDPAAAALPSRIVRVLGMKLEQLPPVGAGINFQAVGTDPEGSLLRTFWTTSGPAVQSTIAGDSADSGAAITSPYQFKTTLGGTYTVYLTIYDQLGLFDECRWIITVVPNNRPQIDVISGRTIVEFGRLDEVREAAGVGPIVPVVGALPPGATPPVAVPSLINPATPVIWSGLTLCPDSVAGPFAELPTPESVLAAPAPVDALTTPVTTDVTNRWQFPGRTCVWAIVADADGDPLTVAFEWPGPIFGSGTFYAAVEVPAGFHASLPGGILQGALIRTGEQLEAYNAWISLLYNAAGVIPAIVWEAWDDPCPPGSGGVANPCPSAISRGGVEAIVARVSDGFSLPPAIGYAYIGVGPDAFGGGECGPVFFISSLTPVPSDPLPFQGVTVTARLSPVTEACPVILAVVGTDGFADRQIIPSNKSGEASLFIPGGAEGIVDRVTAEVCVPVNPNATPPPPDQQCMTTTGLPGWLLFMEVTYAF